MNDLTEIIISALNKIREIQNYNGAKGTPDVKELANALNDELAEIQKGAALLIQENFEQKNEICRLKALTADESGLVIKNNVYYNPDGDGPFCPVCKDLRGKRIRLRRDSSDEDSIVLHVCRVCGNSFSG
jgi:hypothetical protein